VDAAIEGQRLDRDQRLIMVHRYRGIVGLPGCLVKHRVCRARAADVYPERTQLGDCRGDDLLILAAETAIFSRMGVEAGNPDAWIGDAEIALQGASGDPDGSDDEFLAQARSHPGEGNMDCNGYDPQLI